MNPINFLKYNPQKRLTVYAYIYSAIYRLELFFIKPNIYRNIGESKEKNHRKKKLHGNTGMR